VSKIQTLFIEDNKDYAQLVEFYLKHAKSPAFEVTWAGTLKKALEILGSEKKFDIILTDLFLPDSPGLSTFTVLQKHHGNIPIVVITAYDDEKVAVNAVQSGAQDYLVKGDITGKMIARVLAYAIERHRMQMDLKSLSLTDELTGLRNRRGFLTLAEQHAKLSYRTKRGFAILLADLDGLKMINDRYGHSAGDQALIATGQAMIETFRQSDVIARFGGDEFAILAIDVESPRGHDMMARLMARLDKINLAKKFPFKIEVSIGTAYSSPEHPADLDQLFAAADKELYRQKSSKRTGEGSP
jgi:diguanylate cyclase (GGDEF)-like protein